ncbi:hypothetical protein GALL_375910 [mine drainage metagenome]|uniref:DUF1841 domain-containing protein n=1 Tax=mine drainage metagenome TaxID=410659 RepID=A0A1J5QBT1_9ZZZZ
MFNPSRDQVRRFFFEAWRKYRAGEPLTPLERMAVQVVLNHAEYQPVLDAPEKNLEREYFPEMGETNPFLHMSLHLSILEQLSIDQPPGIAAAYQALLNKRGDEHPAQHDLMDCLAETLWRAQRAGSAPDAAAYLAAMQKAAYR